MPPRKTQPKQDDDSMMVAGAGAGLAAASSPSKSKQTPSIPRPRGMGRASRPLLQRLGTDLCLFHVAIQSKPEDGGEDDDDDEENEDVAGAWYFGFCPEKALATGSGPTKTVTAMCATHSNAVIDRRVQFKTRESAGAVQDMLKFWPAYGAACACGRRTCNEGDTDTAVLCAMCEHCFAEGDYGDDYYDPDSGLTVWPMGGRFWVANG